MESVVYDAGYQHVELDDLDDLEGHIFTNEFGEDKPEPALPLLPESHQLTSFTFTILSLLGDRVPQDCTPKKSGRHRDEKRPHFWWSNGCFREARFEYKNGDGKKSFIQEDFDEMEVILRSIICRYAISIQDHVALMRHIDRVTPEAYFGLCKLAIDQGNVWACKCLLLRRLPEEIGPASRLSALFEYAALRGSLDVMKKLHKMGINVEGDKQTHPLSAAVASGSIDAVKLLYEWGATLTRKNCKSIVKRYKQTPLTIAASHYDVAMVKYLLSVGAVRKEPEPRHDAFQIALADHQPSMIISLLKSGITFAESHTLPERTLEIAVAQGNVELAEISLRAGADPNAEEHCVRCADYQEDLPPTTYGTLFQWACASGDIDMVQTFLDHGVDFDKPLQSWANWRYEKPVYVAWSCGHLNVVRMILGYYDEIELVQFTCYVVQKGHFFMFEHCMEHEAVRKQASWLLKKCLSSLHSMSNAKSFPSSTGKGHVLIIKALIGMGAWLPSDKTWHLSNAVLSWLGHKSLEDFLANCTSMEIPRRDLCAEEVRRRAFWGSKNSGW
ncbi:hypothetical protein HBI23_219640 [Parastagonospora nodorum]|nr:hypothetical protein HBH75_215000 [Parastagonospora nodorum]KAH5396108.1 hypothetical protein HBI47_226580 [Parastagonospora nodorum]KAH5631690.1 hypothetical protein HBI23_219640 [Parastagonospora nodorum]KAH5986820.1 hypothetical protein HBI84_214110 [Parastagonospora nodorum]KAH6049124.1 hypothetical protein HBI67_220110 [Parastagonospora nodorum]